MTERRSDSGGEQVGEGSTKRTKRRALLGRLAGSALALLTVSAMTVQLLAEDTESSGAAPLLAPEGEARRVLVAKVEVARLEQARRFHGQLRARQRATLSFTIGGRMVGRPVELGDSVKRGQVVARLDPRPLSNQVNAARASVRELETRIAQAERDTRRAEQLLAGGVATRSEAEQTASGHQALLAARGGAGVQLGEARRVLAESVLRAPFDAEVVALFLEEDEFASPGAPVLLLSGSGELELEVHVPEQVLQDVREGAEVSLDLPLLGRRGLSGTVRSVGQSSAGNRLFPVLVRVAPDPALRAGVTAELVLDGAGQERLVVPVSAVLSPSGERPSVFALRPDGRVARIRVEVHELFGDRVAVSGDLTPGSEVVTGGHAFLLDGDLVEPARARTPERLGAESDEARR